jgi:hypothetical protein
MTCFLSPERQAILTETLTNFEVAPKAIQTFINNLPDDDLDKIDDEMQLHVLTVIECRGLGRTDQACIGLAVLAVIMQEAKSRGLGETDFPKMLKATKDDLQSHYGMDDDAVDEAIKNLPPGTLQ